MKKVLTVLLLSSLLLTGCHKKKPVLTPQDMGSDKTMYEKAMRYIRRDPEKARLLFKEVMQIYPDSIYASKAKLGVADSYFREKDMASLLLAASEYQEYVNLYPYSPDAVFAKHQVGMCYYRQMNQPERDQANTYLAIKAFEGVIEQYPGTAEAESSRKKIAELRQNLAMHYFLIGYFNYRMKAYEGAIVRFKQVLNDYPDFRRNARLFYFTGLAYYALKDFETARSFFQRVLSDFPKYKYAPKSTRMIKRINKKLKKKVVKNSSA